jgi:hypothetical protein
MTGAGSAGRDGGDNIQTAALSWPTPSVMLTGEGTSPEAFQVRQRRLKEKHGSKTGNGAGPDLAMAAKTWPPPTTRDHKDTGNLDNVPENALLGRVAANWATPRASDGEKGGPHQSFGAGGEPLVSQTIKWATPIVQDSKQSGHAPTGTGQVEKLSFQAAQWPTPTSLSFGESHQQGNSKSMNETLRLVSGLAASRPDPGTATAGPPSSPARRSLNPLFVEWLMGWPPGWTLISLPELTGSACSATASCRYRQDMQSALLQLALPPAAPPVQSDLFG